MKRILLVLLATLACNKADLPVYDAGAERISSDTAPQSDVAVSLAVDFTVENCPSFDVQGLTCTGNVPLAVRFVPLATTTVTQYSWNFGDAIPFDGELAPSHVYATPGVYSVTVVATDVSGRIVTKAHAGFIVAQANPIGDPCDSNLQCETGLFCLCPASAPCNPGPAHGLCASSCQTGGTCGDAEVCAGLRTAAPPAGKSSAWQSPLCLSACTKDADCAGGLHCRTFPPGPAGSAWIRGCFAAVPGDVGDPCLDDEGNLRDDLCASGLCADLGADGLCSMNCAAASCPPGSDCAVLGDGRKLCLRPCVGSFTCSRDPLLSCVVPAAGDLGYKLVSTKDNGEALSYCAPQSCVADAPTGDKCLPTGVCTPDEMGGGHCVRRKN